MGISKVRKPIWGDGMKDDENKKDYAYQLANIENEENQITSTADSARAIEQVRVQVECAKKFPRDRLKAYQNIIESCKRLKFADEALYSYPRGGKRITGESIRLTETMAQCWGNLEFGVVEISSEEGHSVMQSFCWDLESNVRQSKTFKVQHARWKKDKRTKEWVKEKLIDQRDIYENNANYASRRLRACILGIIPKDVSEDAKEQCIKTQQKGDGTPLEDRIRKLLQLFAEVGVTKEMIEIRLGHKIEAIDATELADMRQIYLSIQDGMSTRSKWFAFSDDDAPIDDSDIDKAESDLRSAKTKEEMLKIYNSLTDGEKRALKTLSRELAEKFDNPTDADLPDVNEFLNNQKE